MSQVTPETDASIKFRSPTIADGAEMWRVVTDSGVLDPNSCYMYLLLCKDFADTCVVAEHEGRVVGFVTGYRPPTRPDAIFLWQVGVDAAMRGCGLGKRLLAAFLQSSGAAGAARLETTISPSNEASKALFASVARSIGADMTVATGFTEADFPADGNHEAEELYLIGPLDPTRTEQLSP
ncbi:diaminobutyrate acetyltransferase [Methylonatrum kenyense]|uniref:diaminobutyrate acetyltransferase n=1 Tax=Methylonatrum kenyense TaxID=455253 RepID=UPI0020C02FEA|nr:diaminobutyrate acetyltransferase [Methylonatrum kenyense]MCK8514890.1 diaminobutyrate acetyltransferase [Methylonatrum kenyense]